MTREARECKKNDHHEVPDDDHDSIEEVEAVRHVSVASFSDQFEDHFDGEDESKDEVGDLDGLRQFLGLIVVLDTHDEGIYQNSQKNKPLEVAMIYEGLHEGSKSVAHVATLDTCFWWFPLEWLGVWIR